MRNTPKNLRLNVKVSLLGAISGLATALVLVLLAVWQSGKYGTLAQNEVDDLIDADLNHIAKGVYNLVQTENESAQQQVNYNLNVARRLLANAGGVSLSKEMVPWNAVNQFTGQAEKIQVPRILIGGKWSGQNTNPAVEAAVVDEVAHLVGETATIFQRMNDRGDMLRVATTILDSEGNRAIGTYIPAVYQGGASNPVIKAILENQTYHGRAYVVNGWYITAYEPVLDNTGRVAGMLYVGVKQKNIESRVRNAILQTKVGKTGYVYVLGGKGEEQGHYIVSQRGERDGENIWDTRDSDGRYIIQAIIHKALSLPPGELATERYRWQNPGEHEPRWKIARLACYEPWDWVIGTSVYEDELKTYAAVLIDGRSRMTKFMILAGLLISVLIVVSGIFIAWSIAQPVRQMTDAVEAIIGGNLDRVVDIPSEDEIGKLARAFNTMTGRLKKTLEGLRENEEKYRAIVENALEGLYQTTFEGKFLSANPAMARIFGYGSPDDLKASIADIRRQLFVHPEDRDAFVSAIRESGKVGSREVQCHRKDGEIIWVSISGRMVGDAVGKPLFIEGFLYDITERKRAEEEIHKLNAELERRVLERTRQLEAANQELEAFSYSVSHDLRAPLRSIDGFSQALLEDCDERLDARGKEYLHRVRRASQRMAQLIDDLLKLSRVSRHEMHRARVDLTSLAREVSGELRATNKDRLVDFLIAPGLVANADANLIRIAIENLLENAWKFTSKHPAARIEFGASSPGDGSVQTIFFVRDDGAGFDIAYATKLFGAFQRLHSSSEFGGMGIGLATVQRIIRRHGGHVWAEATVEKGATFYFTLPS